MPPREERVWDSLPFLSVGNTWVYTEAVHPYHKFSPINAISGFRLPGVKSWLYYLFVVWPWSGCSTSITLNFSIYYKRNQICLFIQQIFLKKPICIRQGARLKEYTGKWDKHSSCHHGVYMQGDRVKKSHLCQHNHNRGHGYYEENKPWADIENNKGVKESLTEM